MNKTELIASVAAKTKMTKKATGEAIAAIVASIEKELSKGGKVQLIGFGTFQVRARKARKGRNPQSGKPIQIPASKHPVFSAGKALKDAANGKKAAKK
jgi:DNA-binding protein HU-beta